MQYKASKAVDTISKDRRNAMQEQLRRTANQEKLKGLLSRNALAPTEDRTAGGEFDRSIVEKFFELSDKEKLDMLENSFFESKRFETQYQKSDEQLLNEALNLEKLRPVYGHPGWSLDDLSSIQGYEGGSEELRKAFEQHGMGGQISLDEIARDIWRETTPGAILDVITDQTYSFSGTDVGASDYHIDKKMENVAALYAFYADKAARNYSGDEYTKIMQGINATFEAQIDELADQFVGDGSFIQGDIQGVKDSVKSIFHSRKSVYEQAIKSESFKTGVEGTKDAWALDSGHFVTAKLRQYVDSTAQDSPSISSEIPKYSLDDLKTIAVLRAQGMNIDSDSEEQVGMELGFKALTMELLLKESGASQNLEEMLRQSMEIEIQKQLNRMDEYFEWQRKDTYTDKSYSYEGVDKNAVNRAISEMLLALKAPDFGKGVRSVIELINERYTQKRAVQLEGGSKIMYRYALDKLRDPASASGLKMLVTYLDNPRYNLGDMLVGVDKYA